MSAPLIWVVGAGGLLGSHVQAAVSRRFPRARFWQSTPLHFSWTDSIGLADELNRAVSGFAAAVRSEADSWALLWCAGKGTVGSTAAALEPESTAWVRVLDLLGRDLAGQDGGRAGYVFLASSAGGVYGGNPPDVLTENSPPQAASEYGVHKLAMEEALRHWNAGFPNVSCLIGRISTLYGPGQDLRKPQGIISHLSRCLIHRRQVSIYVPLDTRRDYFFVADCAHHIAACLDRLMSERPQLVLKIIASERLTSLAQIVGIFFRIAKHRSLIVLQQAQRTQSISLKLGSNIWPDLAGLRATDLAAGIHIVHAHQLGLFQRGLLPPPQ